MEKVQQEIAKAINNEPIKKEINNPGNTPVVDNTIAVDGKLLVDILNLIHKDHAEVIDSYNGLLSTVIKSGKVKF